MVVRFAEGRIAGETQDSGKGFPFPGLSPGGFAGGTGTPRGI